MTVTAKLSTLSLSSKIVFYVFAAAIFYCATSGRHKPELFVSDKLLPSADRVPSRIQACVKNTPFSFHPFVRAAEWDWPIQSTVQSVREDGPSGLPLRCDWVIGTRMQHWRRVPLDIAYGNIDEPPRTIFVQREYLQSFNDYLLPCIKHKIVLIVGDHDLSTPLQMDVRYRFINTVSPYWVNKSVPNSFKYSTWLSWLSDLRVHHIFVEHLDEKGHSKVSPIPLGLDPTNLPLHFMRSLTVQKISNNTYQPLSQRPLVMRFTNRMRNGIQWRARAETREKCVSTWREFCTSSPAPNGEEFFNDLKKYPFVLCAHGGGIDPNPLAWTTLIAGSIPIIQRFPGDDIYDGLPVVKLTRLPADEINVALLQIWLQELEPQFYGDARVRVVEKLMADYWWEKNQRVVELMS